MSINLEELETELLANPEIKHAYDELTPKYRDIGQELLDGVRAIKQGEGERFPAPDYEGEHVLEDEGEHVLALETHALQDELARWHAAACPVCQSIEEMDMNTGECRECGMSYY